VSVVNETRLEESSMTAISVRGLTKRFGGVTAVEDLSFDVQPGTLTGFVGPNGAGKTTTLRSILGLVRPTAGTAVINGVPYARLDRPARHVGAVLEASGFHPGRTARDHLRVLATPTGIPTARVDQVLAEVDLTGAARRRVGGFSLGMRQRLGLAAALLGDPGILILDEPTNGLDPAGVHWLRTYLRGRVEAGGTVLVSSHLLAELALAADSVIILKDGRLVTQGPVSDLTGAATVRVRTPQALQLLAALVARGFSAVLDGPDEVVASGVGTEAVGEAVAEAGLVVYEMTAQRPALEDAFLALTTDERSRS
jgi:ABC-2 type transport system ATP-binding protein